MCEKKYGVKINSAFLLGRTSLLCHPPHVDEDGDVEEECDENEDETSKDPDCKRCQPFWIGGRVGQDIGEHGHKNLKKMWCLLDGTERTFSLCKYVPCNIRHQVKDC